MSTRKLVSFDWALKKLLRSKVNFAILEGFLSELLEDDIHILEVLESESNQTTCDDKFNRVDLKVRDKKDAIIIIEVQYDKEFDYLQRILYGTSKIITEHIKKSHSYATIVKVISVNILYFDLGLGSDYVYHGFTSFIGIHDHDKLQLSEKQKNLYPSNKIEKIFPEYYLIKVNNFNNIAKDSLDEWIYFLKNEEIKDSFNARGLKEAKQELDILKLPETERQAYEQYQDDLHYQASMFESTYTIGHIEGNKEGKIEGKIEGRIEGKTENQKETAIKLHAAGVEIIIISRCTDLTIKEIEDIISSDT